MILSTIFKDPVQSNPLNSSIPPHHNQLKTKCASTVCLKNNNVQRSGMYLTKRSSLRAQLLFLSYVSFTYYTLKVLVIKLTDQAGPSY